MKKITITHKNFFRIFNRVKKLLQKPKEYISPKEYNLRERLKHIHQFALIEKISIDNKNK